MGLWSTWPQRRVAKGGAGRSGRQNPDFLCRPQSWDDAKNDGERWRFALATAVEADATRRDEVRGLFAEFLHEQFGVQTMASWGALSKSDAGDESGTYALDTLKDSETIAKLATGIKRFGLPDEFNPIVIWKDLASGPKSPWGEAALDRLASVYQDRRQYVTAAATLKKLIDTYGAGVGESRRAALKQITGNWGRFEPARCSPPVRNRSSSIATAMVRKWRLKRVRSTSNCCSRMQRIT